MLAGAAVFVPVSNVVTGAMSLFGAFVFFR